MPLYMTDNCSMSILLLSCAGSRSSKTGLRRSSYCSVSAPMNQKAKEPDNKHGPPVDNRARSGGHGGIPESSCASACGLNRKAPVLHIPIPGRSDSRRQNGEVGPGPGAGIGEQPELGPPEMKPQLRLPRRAQAPRGPCGQANDISPRGPQSGPVTPPQTGAARRPRMSQC